jgi:hypothetical protein
MVLEIYNCRLEEVDEESEVERKKKTEISACLLCGSA